MVMIFGGFTSFSTCLPNRAHFRPEDSPADPQPAVHKFNTSSFITTYFPIPFFAVLFCGYKLVKRSKMVAYHEMDFVSHCSVDMPSEPPKGKWWKTAVDYA